jgi:hypothetical protein
VHWATPTLSGRRSGRLVHGATHTYSNNHNCDVLARTRLTLSISLSTCSLSPLIDALQAAVDKAMFYEGILCPIRCSLILLWLVQSQTAFPLFSCSLSMRTFVEDPRGETTRFSQVFCIPGGRKGRRPRRIPSSWDTSRLPPSPQSTRHGSLPLKYSYLPKEFPAR